VDNVMDADRLAVDVVDAGVFTVLTPKLHAEAL
jgi:hypothetical protein